MSADVQKLLHGAVAMGARLPGGIERKRQARTRRVVRSRTRPPPRRRRGASIGASELIAA